MKKEICAALVSGLLASSVNAEDAVAVEGVAADVSPWTASIELGFLRTTGNTETQNALFKGDVVYEVEKWRHTGHAEAYGNESEDANGVTVVSAERYELSGKSDYKFSELDYAYASVKLEKDHFSGFEYDHIVSVGYGRKAIKEVNMGLDLEIGPGVRLFKVDNLSSDDEAVLRLSGNYWWGITAASKFTQELTTEIGEDVTSTTSITGVQANISKVLAMKFTYTIRNKSKVPLGTEKTDTEIAMTLVYDF